MELGRFSKGTGQARTFRFGNKIANRLQQFREVQGFFHESASAGSQSREQLIRTRRNNDDRHKRRLERHLLKGFPAVLAGHIQIQKDQVYGIAFDNRERFQAVGRRLDAKAFGIEQAGHRLADGVVVINQQNGVFHNVRGSNSVCGLKDGDGLDRLMPVGEESLAGRLQRLIPFKKSVESGQHNERQQSG